MRLLLRALAIVAALAALAAAVAATSPAAPSSRAKVQSVPRWLKAAETLTLDRVFGGARPVRINYISYPHKVAVIFEFDHVVICGACSAPSNASLPRGRVIRVSYDRITHRQGGAKDGVAMQFCEARKDQPPRSLCLHR
jgi:hypothetical protein